MQQHRTIRRVVNSKQNRNGFTSISATIRKQDNTFVLSGGNNITTNSPIAVVSNKTAVVDQKINLTVRNWNIPCEEGGSREGLQCSPILLTLYNCFFVVIWVTSELKIKRKIHSLLDFDQTNSLMKIYVVTSEHRIYSKRNFCRPI